MNSVHTSIILTVVFVLLLSSCASYQYHGVKPISPSLSLRWGMGGLSAHAPESIDSIQPTFYWDCMSSYEMIYDIIIYKAVRHQVAPDCFNIPGEAQVCIRHDLSASGTEFMYYYTPGEKVYYREGIEGCIHHIETALEGDTVYVWSVRVHSDISPRNWSTYDFQQGTLPFDIYTQRWGSNLWFSFSTPWQE